MLKVFIFTITVAGPADGGGAPQGHVPQPRHHRQEAGQWAGQSGGRHPPQQEAGGDESEMELPQGKEYGNQVRKKRGAFNIDKIQEDSRVLKWRLNQKKLTLLVVKVVSVVVE